MEMVIGMGNYLMKREGHVLLCMNKTFFITVEEAKQIAANIKMHVQDGVTMVIVDNRAVGNGIWSTEVNNIWEELMEWLAGNIGKCATLCAGVTNKMQLNRISRSAGTIEIIQAFTDEREALAFLGIASLPSQA